MYVNGVQVRLWNDHTRWSPAPHRTNHRTNSNDVRIQQFPATHTDQTYSPCPPRHRLPKIASQRNQCDLGECGTVRHSHHPSGSTHLVHLIRGCRYCHGATIERAHTHITHTDGWSLTQAECLVRRQHFVFEDSEVGRVEKLSQRLSEQRLLENVTPRAQCS